MTLRLANHSMRDSRASNLGREQTHQLAGGYDWTESSFYS